MRPLSVGGEQGRQERVLRRRPTVTVGRLSQIEMGFIMAREVTEGKCAIPECVVVVPVYHDRDRSPHAGGGEDQKRTGKRFDGEVYNTERSNASCSGYKGEKPSKVESHQVCGAPSQRGFLLLWIL